MITAHEVKVLAEKFAEAAAAKDIPTGKLWRSITADQYLKAKLELFNAIDELATQRPGAPK